MKSILQSKKECFITHRTYNLHKHHVFEGTANRRKSESWGLWVWLTPELHNASGKGVHFNKELDTQLKQYAQKEFEKLYGHEKWMEVFNKNYL